jgi:two-component system chemotaxis response regulator CheY
MRTILRKILEELGFVVAEAGQGREAVERLQAGWDPMVALVDWNMPEMNGYEFIQTVRANPAWNDIRLMMVTTETEIGQVARALEAGANEYVMKPFTADVIRDKLTLMGIE